MQTLDREIQEVNKWMDGAERKMDEIESQGPNDAVLKVFKLHFIPDITSSWFYVSLRDSDLGFKA